jgi:hypothetical protein
MRLGLNAMELPITCVTAKGQQWATPTTPSGKISSVSPLAIRSSVWVAS